MSHKVVTGIVRLLYIRGLSEKSAPPGSERLRYNVNVLIEKDDSFTLGALQKAFDAAKREGREKLWANKAPTTLKFDNFVRDKSEESHHEVWENVYVIVPKTDYEVKLIDKNKENFDKDNCYDGMNARVSMSLYPYKHESGGKGIGIQLNGIQVIPGGEKVEISYDITKDFEDDYEGDLTDLPDEETKPEEKAEPKRKRRRR